MIPGIFAGGAMGAGSGGGNIDDFSTNTLSLYTLYGTAGTPTISGGQLNFPGTNQAILARTGEMFADGTVGVVISQAADAGFAFRLQDANNYYVAVVRDASAPIGANRVQLYKRVSGTFTDLGTAFISFTRGAPQKFHAVLAGTSIKLYFNDVEVLNRTDVAFSSGLAGPRSTNSPCVFDEYFWP